ncbi:MAG: hypothetical protein ACOX0B_00300 [Minisyncoccales bacterium]
MPYDSTPASEWVEFTNINTWGKYSRAELGPLGTYTVNKWSWKNLYRL